jgi:acyl-coenzyme A thioesterase PaaI-like protein
VTVQDVADGEPLQQEDIDVIIAEMPTEEAVRYLMSHGTAEMDARFLVAMAKGEIEGDARAVRAGSDERTV